MAWQAWQNFLAKRRLLAQRGGSQSLSQMGDDRRIARKDRTPTAPYERLSQYWHEFRDPTLPDYPAYLRLQARLRALTLSSVLDLACGTGVLTQRLPAIASQVVGLDSSAAMLARARTECADLPGVRLIEADFRDFHLGQTFTAAVCASNSLNYVASLDELAQTFRCVAEHLCPGGIFACDTNTSAGMSLLNGCTTFHTAGEGKFAMQLDYCPETRQETVSVIFPDAVEVHRRIALDPADVIEAARASGLRVADYFSSAFVSGRWWTGSECFYLLVKEQ